MTHAFKSSPEPAPGGARPPARRQRSLSAAALALLCLSAAPARPADPPGMPLMLNASEVVKEREVWDIVQDPAGVLYFATNFGVVEHDGLSSTVHSLDNGSIVRSLAVHSSGQVFVGVIGEIGRLTRSGTGQLLYQTLGDEDDPALEGLRDVWRLWPTREGFLAWTLDRILEWNGERLTAWPLEVRTFPARLRGTLLVSDAEGRIQRLDPAGLTDAGRLVETGEEQVRIWIEEPDGGALLLTVGGRFWRLDAGQIDALLDGPAQDHAPRRVAMEVDSELEQRRVYDATRLRDGRLAVATMRGGLLVIGPEGRAVHTLDRSTGLSDNSAWSLFEDRDGGLWIGLSRGLERAALGAPVVDYGEPLGLEGKVQDVTRGLGKLWAATSAGLYALESGGWRLVEEVAGPCWDVLTVGEGTKERILVGAALGVSEVGSAGVRTVRETRHAFALLSSSSRPGTVWVGEESGVARIESGPAGWRESEERRDLEVQARSLAEAPDGSLWIGTLVNGVLRLGSAGGPQPPLLKDTPFERIGPERGLEALRSIKLFVHRDRVMAGTALGLFGWNPESGGFEPSALFGRDTGGIARVSRGFGGRSYWLSRDGNSPLWIETDGEAGPDGAPPSATHVFRFLPSEDVYTFEAESDERTWVGTAKGLFLFRGQPDDGPLSPTDGRRLTLREVLLDGVAQPLGSDPLELPRPEGRLGLRWALPAFDPVRDEERFRSRLVGLDDAWSEWSARTSADYMNLPGGHYVFEAQARDLNGAIVDSLSYRIEVPFPWYLTLPARLGWLTMTGALIWLGVSIRSRHLRQERDRLEELIDERTEELRRARDEARAAAEAKTQFLANMSHEIRTPMNGVIGATDILLSGGLGPRERRFAEIIKSSGQGLLTLIDEVLDVSKIEAGRFELESRPFEVRKTVDSAIAILSPIAQDKGLLLTAEVEGGVPRRLLGDPHRLRQVLVNLAGNALKFTDSGAVTVEVRPEARAESEAAGGGPSPDERVGLRFLVSDTGIGIPRGKQAQLFEPFTQLDTSPTRQHGGTGLGLMISKQLVELMGGRIGVESEEGEGSVFWFTARFLDAEDADTTPGAARAKTRGRPSLAGQKILIVEDNPINQVIAEAILDKLACLSTLAASGEEALRILESEGESFDAILMDVQMPEMDGIDATRRIRALEGPASRVPILAMTAHAMKGDREVCLAAGMNAYLAKPVQLDSLAKALGEVLGESASD
ncbi:MAG: ATP-binding protein [Acidobacteriota bacterium]